MAIRHQKRKVEYRVPADTPENRAFVASHTVVGDDGCHRWTGLLNSHGYGLFYRRYTLSLIHRVVMTWSHGDLGDLTVDHLCRTKPCLRLDHLEPVTRAENSRRAWLTSPVGQTYLARIAAGGPERLERPLKPLQVHHWPEPGPEVVQAVLASLRPAGGRCKVRPSSRHLRRDGVRYNTAVVMHQVFVGPVAAEHIVWRLCPTVGCHEPRHLSSGSPREQPLSGAHTRERLDVNT